MAGSRPDELSTFEQYAMLAIIHLHPIGYGVSIRDHIEVQTGKRYGYGPLYALLNRLEERGFVSTREGEATAERGGRKKTYFEVTAPGQTAVKASLRALDAMRANAKLSGAFA